MKGYNAITLHDDVELKKEIGIGENGNTYDGSYAVHQYLRYYFILWVMHGVIHVLFHVIFHLVVCLPGAIKMFM